MFNIVEKMVRKRATTAGRKTSTVHQGISGELERIQSVEPSESSNSNMSTNSSIDRLTDVVANLLRNLPNAGRSSVRPEAIPYFDPDEQNQDISVWCNKIDEMREIFGWTEEATIFHALAKLEGLAKKWYNGLGSIKNSWNEWKQKLKRAFPSKRDYSELLEEMLRRRKRPDESYANYFHEKLALLNTCKIGGRDAVSCLIAGIREQHLVAAAKAADYADPECLYDFLRTLNEPVRTPIIRHEPPAKRFKRMAPATSGDVNCYKCGKRGHLSRECKKGRSADRGLKTCSYCQRPGHLAEYCYKKKKEQLMPPHRKTETVSCLNDSVKNTPNSKYYKKVMVNNKSVEAYIDFGSTCNLIKSSEVNRLGLIVNTSIKRLIRGYGNSQIDTLGIVSFELSVDKVKTFQSASVVPDMVQQIPLLIGQPFTEMEGLQLIKDHAKLEFIQRGIMDIDVTDTSDNKVNLVVKESCCVPAQSWVNVSVETKDGNYTGDLFIESTLRTEEGKEYCIPRTIITVGRGVDVLVPVVNISDNNFLLKPKQTIIRAWPCEAAETSFNEHVNRVNSEPLKDLPFDKLITGPITVQQRKSLIELLTKYRNVFAENLAELGCAKSTQMEINLSMEKPFTYRPYRMALSEQETVRRMIGELLEAKIVKESDSEYSSPVLLVKKKNGEPRLCIDYRKLNAHTVKICQPLPRIDDQIDKLHGNNYFTSLDLRSGYYQIPIAETSKKYTSFVTPHGQYEFNRMPFGLANAPGVFQKLMNKILNVGATAAVIFLDDILIPSQTVQKGLENLEQVFQLLRNEGLTLNFAKCTFLMAKVNYLGFEISKNKVQPGESKTKAIDEFPVPKTVRQIRQFIGLTGYFRRFVKDYAVIAKPLTNLTRQSVKWTWSDKEQKSFDTLKGELVKRPVLALYNPNAKTEVHTDASMYGLAGILFQEQSDGNLHPVIYYSRQTTDDEQIYHSYELETLAVVESLKKFRVYLIGIEFIVVTDCNALKASSTKKDILPRIARWWLQLQEYNFTVQYRPGNRLKHVDALSRNPSITENATNEETVFLVNEEDWLLTGQLTDTNLKQTFDVLSRPPGTPDEKKTHKNYALRNGRIYRRTAKGLLFIIPRGMRHQVLKSAHDDLGHFGTEKTFRTLSEKYWFPRMRAYVDRYISCCIRCLYNKKVSGKREGKLHPIEKVPVPFDTVHLDHLGPFPRSRRNRNTHIIVMVDAFTKFILLRAAKSTKTQFVTQFLETIIAIFGSPRRLITDQGSAFTGKQFKSFCDDKDIQHVLNAVATPRANGQVERFNRTILNSLLTSTLEEDMWDQNLNAVQFAINNVPNSSTGKTPSELLVGFKPRGTTDRLLLDELIGLPKVVEDLVALRSEAADKITANQKRQKETYDKTRKEPIKYKVGDIVFIEKSEMPRTGVSRKLCAPYSGPMTIKTVLPNDRYIVTDVTGSNRTRRKTVYERVIAVDKIKPAFPDGGISDDTVSESDDESLVQSQEPITSRDEM